MFKIAKIFKGRIEKILNLIFEKSNMDKSIASFFDFTLFGCLLFHINLHFNWNFGN